MFVAVETDANKISMQKVDSLIFITIFNPI
jgi:hypothetical protein